jgi:hypothetical protein
MTATTVVAEEPVESARPAMRSAQQVAEEEGLTFAGTPGPGYSEGGDVYEPNAPPRGWESFPRLRSSSPTYTKGLSASGGPGLTGSPQVRELGAT